MLSWWDFVNHLGRGMRLGGLTPMDEPSEQEDPYIVPCALCGEEHESESCPNEDGAGSA